jgi:hypothetical protein
MKLAIVIPGYLRFWEECKQNFLEKIYDKNQDIDVFIDTYNTKFRSDYTIRNENNHAKVISTHEIYQLFDNINVVSARIEPEITNDAAYLQKRKITNVYNDLIQYEKDHGQYDLVLKTRFDIQLDDPINYEKILSDCENKIYISNGAINCGPKQNDMLAISNSNNMKIYLNRFESNALQSNIHQGIEDIEQHNVEIIPYINISIMRFENDNPILFR